MQARLQTTTIISTTSTREIKTRLMTSSTSGGLSSTSTMTNTTNQRSWWPKVTPRYQTWCVTMATRVSTALSHWTLLILKSWRILPLREILRWWLIDGWRSCPLERSLTGWYVGICFMDEFGYWVFDMAQISLKLVKHLSSMLWHAWRHPYLGQTSVSQTNAFVRWDRTRETTCTIGFVQFTFLIFFSKAVQKPYTSRSETNTNLL